MNYTSSFSDNSGASQTVDRILFFVKTKGPVSTAALARAMDLTAQAARQQVQKLVASGLMEGRREAVSGVGRPRQNWR